MKLHIFALGHKMPAWITEGCLDYTKRMPRELALSVSEIKPETRGSKTRAQLLAAEKARLLPALSAFPRWIVLDERGRDLDSTTLAQHLTNWQREGGDTAFIIGSADGLDDELKTRAQLQIRLSSLTLPHGLARLVLCEQLYRAQSILKNHPYHRED